MERVFFTYKVTYTYQLFTAAAALLPLLLTMFLGYAKETKMAVRFAAFLNNAWAKEPVLVVSFII